MKIVSGLIGVLALVISSLVLAPAADASYPGTVVTSCHSHQPRTVRKHRNLLVSYAIGVPGNGRPTGVVTIRIYRVAKHNHNVFVRSRTLRFAGGAQVRSLGKFTKKGAMRVQVVFTPSRGSVYRSCATGMHGFRVTHG